MKTIYNDLMLPMVRRLGTGLAGFLVGTGAGATETEQIVTGLIALFAVVADLVASKWNRGNA